MSVKISPFENLLEHVESRWLLLALMSTTCAYGAEYVPLLPNYPVFDSVLISLFENLEEHFKSRWLLLAVMSTICSLCVERHPSIPNFRDFDLR